MSRYIRKAMVVAIALGFAGIAGTAAADFDLYVQVDKFKTVYVDEYIDIEKDVEVNVLLDQVLEGAAEAMVVVNVTNQNNIVDHCVDSCPSGPNLNDQFPEYGDQMIELDAQIEDSVLNNSGIIGVNQDVGNMVNQANVVSFSSADFAQASVDGSANRIFGDAQSEISQSNTVNYVRQEEVIPNPDDIFGDPDKTALISSSINGNSGLIGVNQNAGNMNNQTNGLALAVGLGNAVVLSEAALGQENTDNQVIGVQTIKTDDIVNSVNGNTGVVQVNQSVGNMNNQGSSIAFGALKVTASVGVPGS